MKNKILLVFIILLSLSSCSSTFTTLSKDEYAELSYTLPAIYIMEKPDYAGIGSKYYSNELNRTTALENHFNKKIDIRSLDVLDSIVIDNQVKLAFTDSKSIQNDIFNKVSREKLGDYYLQLIRYNPKKVETPEWLKDILKTSKTNKNLGFVLHRSYKVNEKRERTDPLVTYQPMQLYSMIWNKKGKLLALEKSDILSEGIEEIEFDKAWKKTIFTLLKK
ncbi:hypothetical protein ACFQ3R_11230 [Mesonia ostreae]|uniref:Lipoprotein n=1 Tax=Mesonia ostreae TaxID=861110 RepID=A0ABU2KGW4_9FLAO|nr:hypothetical protein [Mesonia ostreae]MDT0293953.1 hypothetical protein [Mesonia ostreae]